MDQCPKCAGEMVSGYVPDTGPHPGLLYPFRWFDGQEQMARLQFLTPKAIKAPKGNAGVPLAAFRCAKCGYVEWFAREEFEPQ